MRGVPWVRDHGNLGHPRQAPPGLPEELKEEGLIAAMTVQGSGNEMHEGSIERRSWPTARGMIELARAEVLRFHYPRPSQYFLNGYVSSQASAGLLYAHLEDLETVQVNPKPAQGRNSICLSEGALFRLFVATENLRS